MKKHNYSLERINKARLISEIELMIQDLGDFMEDLLGSEEGKDGSLILKRIQGKTRYYLKANGCEKYIGREHQKDLVRYAQSRYREEMIPAVEREIAQLKRCVVILKSEKKGPSDVGTVFDSLPEELKSLVDPYPLSDSEYAKNWQENENLIKKRRQNKKDKYHIYETQNGEYVMSKSEALIANILKDRGVPYHYEIAITPEIQLDYDRPIFDIGFDGKMKLVGYEPKEGFSPFNEDTLHPDFLVLNKRTRREYLWEHLGMVDDDEYCKKNLNRLLRFLDAGYRIGDEVIVSSEGKENPLDTKKINEIIDKYLV